MPPPPHQHFKVDRKGMLKGFQTGDEDHDDDEEEDLNQDEGKHEQQPHVITLCGGGKHKKAKHDHKHSETSNSKWDFAGGFPMEPDAVPSTIKVRKSTDSQISSSIPGLSSILDMSLTEFDADAQKSHIKNVVKKHMFPIWKFYDRQFDSHYSEDERTLCGFIMKHSGMKGNETWWTDMRKVVRKTHTDMRNNAIKNMQAKFKGKHRANYDRFENGRWWNKLTTATILFIQKALIGRQVLLDTICIADVTRKLITSFK
jgi:hypothetical protein